MWDSETSGTSGIRRWDSETEGIGCGTVRQVVPVGLEGGTVR